MIFMKRLGTIAVLLLMMACTAQKQGLRSFHLPMLQEADLLYIQEDYRGAAAIYEHVLEANPAHPLSNLRMGICRLNIRNQQTSALKYLERAKEQQMPEATYYIGIALYFQERFEDATKAFENYLESGDHAIPEPQVHKYLKMVERGRKAYENPRNHRLTNLGPEINSPYPDYVPLISADGTQLFFTSRRENEISNHQDPNGDYFEDIYSSQKVAESWSTAKNIGAPVNTASHDATVALSPSGNRLLIYRTNELLDGGDIFLTELDSAGWGKPEKFTDRVNSRFFEPSATIASDERTIYFSSNRPGGFGGKDIYRVVELPDGTWSHPMNLGPSINTAGHEDGPFISADGKALYFSSTGHDGIGGYDIFKSEWDVENRDWGTLQTLGHPVNTVFDDIYLVLEGSGQTGYYSTNRQGGLGDHDIYKVEFGAENPQILVKGKILNQEDRPVRAEISVENQRGDVARYQSNARSGKYVLLLQPGEKYNVEISGLDYETLSLQLQYEEELGEHITEVDRDFLLKQLNQQSSNE